MKAYDLYNKHTTDELTEMARREREDPKNLNPAGHVQILNSRGRQRMDAISWAITWHIGDRRKKEAIVNA